MIALSCYTFSTPSVDVAEPLDCFCWLKLNGKADCQLHCYISMHSIQCITDHHCQIKKSLLAFLFDFLLLLGSFDQAAFYIL